MNNILITMMAVVLALFLSSSPAAADWDKFFGGADHDEGKCAQQTTDGGYIMVGYTCSYGAGDSDVWLIRTDEHGNALWKRTFGGPKSDMGRCVRETVDGGYIIAGHVDSDEPGWSKDGDGWLIKTDADGVELWSRTFGGAESDDISSVQQTTDGGYIVAGYTYPNYPQRYDADVWLIKTDADGVEQWSSTIGETGFDCGRSVQQTADGGYIIAGYTRSFNVLNDVWLVKTNADGVKEWDQVFGGAEHDEGKCVQQTTDGGYIIAGDTGSYGAGDNDIWLIKTDATGKKQWDRTLGGPYDDRGYSMDKTTSGGYIITGYTRGQWAGDTDVWLVRTDELGNVMWERTFGDYTTETGCSVQQTNDGGAIILGTDGIAYYREGDLWLIKVDSMCTDYYRDLDGDNYGDSSDVRCLDKPSDPYTAGSGGDCDDMDPQVNPGMTEVLCNAKDEDCNEATPDDPNADGDPVSFCEGDCDDTEPANYPGNQEVCDDGIDNDCDGFVDTDDIECPCPELTQISCLYPWNEAIVYETPVFTWDTNAGTACHSFAVDLSLRPAFSRYWSTYENLHQAIKGGHWVMPQYLWDRVPLGTTVYWRVRGADIDHGLFNVTTSAEARRFYKW